MSRWLTGDSHYYHKNIIKYCSRPFHNVLEMNAVLEANWNALVEPQDTVYHLGDFAFTRGYEYEVASLFGRLHGHKILVKGNHDKTFTLSLPWKEVYLKDVEVDGAVLVHDGGRFVRENPGASETPIFSANVHDIYKVKENILNLGVDCWHFLPVGWGVAMEYWRYRWTYWQSLQNKGDL